MLEARRLGRVGPAAAVVIALLFAGCSASTESAPKPKSNTRKAGVGTPGIEEPSGTKVVEPGTYGVGMKTETQVDESRPTKAHGGEAEKPERTLPVVVFYPSAEKPGEGAVEDAAPAADEGPFPLVVFSHGVGAFGSAYKTTLEVIASAGYVVVAPTYPLGNNETPGGATISDMDQQTGDVSFLLDTYTEASAAADGQWSGLIDPELLAVAGHSMGAITSMGVGFQDCCTDPRLDAVAEWSGIFLPLDDDKKADLDPDADDRPLLIVHGDDDAVVPYAGGEAFFDLVKGPKHFVTLPGEGHVTAFVQGLGTPASSVVTLSTINFFDAYVKGDENGLDRLKEDVGSDESVALLEEQRG